MTCITPPGECAGGLSVPLPGPGLCRSSETVCASSCCGCSPPRRPGVRSRCRPSPWPSRCRGARRAAGGSTGRPLEPPDRGARGPPDAGGGDRIARVRRPHRTCDGRCALRLSCRPRCPACRTSLPGGRAPTSAPGWRVAFLVRTAGLRSPVVAAASCAAGINAMPALYAIQVLALAEPVVPGLVVSVAAGALVGAWLSPRAARLGPGRVMAGSWRCSASRTRCSAPCRRSWWRCSPGVSRRSRRRCRPGPSTSWRARSWD